MPTPLALLVLVAAAASAAAAGPAFYSKEVKHLEPVTALTWSELPDAPADDVNVRGGRRLHSSWSKVEQPHANTIHLEFTIFGKPFVYDLQVMHWLYAHDSMLQVDNADGSSTHVPHQVRRVGE